ncbi:MAG: NADH-quinone oxidoreductase subunit NuoH [Cyclobacteriaceae bacterium]|nr:NADH-quinone oxidoreductase subunit NuoH [Cyclobacteriaceae bacterium]MCH8515258.1 NADH-quinone oxidoreductase subunit NuoH [Cyclobacteriaceae bacterium]
MDYIVILDKTILIVAIFIVSLAVAAYATFGERKVAAWLQDRVGPNRAGPFGLLQPVADGVKMFMKEEIIPNAANKKLFIIAPAIFMVTALMSSAIIPWGKPFEIGDRQFHLLVADLNIGMLFVFAMVALGSYGIMIGGWASNSKFSLMGALRSSSQMISYELPLGMSIVALILFAGTLNLTEIVEMQKYGNWNVFYQPLGFIIFLVCVFAECGRAPFDMPESESELVGGFHTEYSSMKLGLFLFAEYIHMFISSAILATLFFGGYHFPGIDSLDLAPNIAALVSIVVLFSKIFFFIFLFMWVRWTLPRFRFDQVMNLGWNVLIPLSLLNILATAAYVTFF